MDNAIESIAKELIPIISFTVLGNPKPQKRHRSVRVGKFIRMYDPSSKEKDDFLWMAHRNAPKTSLIGPIQMNLNFYFQRPKNHFNSKQILKNTAPIFHISKPDIDNLEKLIFDSLKGIYYKDDSQICKVNINKYYSLKPRTEVFIYQL
jgi:Holliday junction resolvase RusA-like endonuclease